jgi:KRAB domain-containing zinc finger protein
MSVHVNRHKMKYFCSLCDGKFTTSQLLERHERKIHKIENMIYICKRCPFKSKIKLERELHRAKVHRGLFCEFCDRIFTDKSHFEVHMKAHGGSKGYNCEPCKRSFKSARSLELHCRNHQQPKTKECKVCSKTFKNFSQIHQHMNLVHKSKIYSNFFSSPKFVHFSFNF